MKGAYNIQPIDPPFKYVTQLQQLIKLYVWHGIHCKLTINLTCYRSINENHKQQQYNWPNNCRIPGQP